MNVKLTLAKMVEYVQTLLLTIPVSAQVNSWEEIVNTVSISIYIQSFICIACICYRNRVDINIVYFQNS